MAYKIVYKSSVERDLKKIDKKQLKHIFDKIDSEHSAKPESFPMLSGKFAGLRKYRIGNYRVIYSILDDSVLILRIAHRKESYK